MELSIAALVGTLPNERLEVRLPTLSDQVFVGPSLTELLDDAALHLMESVPKWDPARLHRLILNPSVTLRKVTVDTELRFGQAKKKTAVKRRLTCFCTYWSADGHWIVEVPRLGGGPFAVRSLSDLNDGLATWLQRWARTGSARALENAATLRDPYLEIVDVDLELPSVLPSRRPKKRKKKTSKPDGTPKAPEKKRWIPARELRHVGINLTQRALDGRLHPARGRDALVDDIATQLIAEGAAILLVGEPGVGKSAVIEAVAARYARKSDSLKTRTDFWRVDGGRLIAGMSYVGAWESRMSEIVEEIYQRDDVLVIEDLPSLAWTGRSAQSETTMAGYLLPHLQRGELRILAECTPERLEAGRQKSPSFFANFRIIQVDGLSEEATYRVLLGHLRDVAQQRDLAADPELLEATIGLARRFGPPLAEPGRSVTLARRFLGEVRPEKRDAFERWIVRPSHLVAYFAAETGLPRFVLEPGTGRPVSETRDWFADHIVGQQRAIDAVTDVVTVLQEGLDDPHKPVATLLFVGPTGVGKTETAKALARFLFGDARRLLRFDMSEVRGPAAIHRLVGGGGRPDGDLTRAVSNQPFSVVLFDEIEKAGPEVFDLLLQVLGEGRLTNAVGRTTDFRNTVVVMTSNLGVASSRRRTGFGQTSTEADASHYRKAAQDFFRPEFYNRIDQVVPFRSLGEADVEPLVQRLLSRVLGRRGLRRSGVVVHLDAALRDWIAEIGFDPVYGARSLQRVVERELTVPLARLLADHPSQHGGAYIDLWRDAEGLELHYDPLVDADELGSSLDMPEDWDGLQALHGQLLKRLAEIETHANFARIETERTELLEAVAQGDLEEADWERLRTSTAVIENRASVLSDLTDFATDYLASFVYEDGYSVSVRNTDWGGEVRQLVTQAVPIPVDRTRTRGAATESLRQLELSVAGIVHRVQSYGPSEPVTLVVEPLHDEADRFASQVAAQFASAWQRWGIVGELVRVEGTWQAGEHGPGACAVRFVVPGLRDLLLPECGLYLETRDVGVDRMLRLVRVAVVDGEGPSEALLTVRDAQRVTQRDALRAGDIPWPALEPVMHRFGAQALSVSALSTRLFERAMRRVVR